MSLLRQLMHCQNQTLTQFVKFPLTCQEVQVKQEEFMEDYRFPGVVGTIDGTHIKIVAPSVDEHLYVNRKRYHSINVQVVFDAKYRILDVLARWPGSVHDARILDKSGLKALFEQNYVPAGCYLLGDSGYPCKEWLLTPYLNPLAGVQTNYNTAHKRTRCVVERGIGQLKRRFHVLHGEVRLSPEKTCKIVYVCALLHNVCKQFNIPVPINEEEEVFHDAAEGDVGADEEEPGEAEIPPNPGRPAGRNGHPFRDYIANLHFSCKMSTPPEDPEFAQVMKVKRLLTKAKKGLPQTSSFYNTIYMHTKFLDKCEFYIPRKHHLDTIIMWKMTKVGRFTQPKQQQVGLLSFEEPAEVVKLLDKTKLLDWTSPITFMHLPVALADPITQMLKRKGSGHLHSCQGTLYIMHKSQKCLPLRCPRGYRLALLGNKGITMMLKKSQFTSVYTVPEFREFSANVPCIGLFMDANQTEVYEVGKKLPQAEDTETPIAYASVCYSGTIGMVGCDDKHWRDGLMTLVLQVCGRMTANMGLISNMYVQDSNVGLKGLMDFLPCWMTRNAVTWAWSCDGSLCP